MPGNDDDWKSASDLGPEDAEPDTRGAVSVYRGGPGYLGGVAGQAFQNVRPSIGGKVRLAKDRTREFLAWLRNPRGTAPPVDLSPARNDFVLRVASSSASGMSLGAILETAAQYEEALATHGSTEKAPEKFAGRSSAVPKAKEDPLGTIKRGQRFDAARFRAGINPFSGVAAAGNALISQYTDLYYDIKRRRSARLGRLSGRNPGSRTGAASTRAFQPRAVPGRSGSGSTRRPDIYPDSAAGKPAIASIPAATQLPTRSDSVGKPARSFSRARDARPLTQARSLFKLGTRSRSNYSTMVESMLGNALAPRTRAATRAAARSITTTRASPLTAVNPAVLTSTSTGLGVATQTASQRQRDCDCGEKKTKTRTEPRCKNPVVSRTVRDGIRTTKVRLICPPSKSKRRSPRTRPTATSSAVLLSSILGGGSF